MHPATSEKNASGVLANYLTRDQLAEELGVTTRTISRWRWERKGPPAHKVAGRILFKRTDVEAWLDQQREEGDR